MYGSSSLRYNLQAPPTSESLQLSLDVRPDNLTGSLLYLRGEGEGEEHAALHLDGSNVVFKSNTFKLVAGNETVQVGQWYQIYASEDELGTWLSVAPLQGGRVYTHFENIAGNHTPISYDASVLLGGRQVGPWLPWLCVYMGGRGVISHGVPNPKDCFLYGCVVFITHFSLHTSSCLHVFPVSNIIFCSSSLPLSTSTSMSATVAVSIMLLSTACVCLCLFLTLCHQMSPPVDQGA